MGSCMVYKVMQDIASMGAARCGGAAREQRPVGRQSTDHHLLGQPSPPPWPRGPMACYVLYSLSVCVCGDSRTVAYRLRGVCH